MQDLKLSRIGGLPLFGAAERRRLRDFAAVADEVTVRRGTTLVARSDKTTDFFVIEQGRALRSVEGHEPLPLGRGDVFGELPVDHTHGAAQEETVVAETDLRVLIVRRQAFPLLRELVPGLNGTLMEASALHSGF